MTKQIEVAKPHLRKSIVVEYKGKSNAVHRIKIKDVTVYLYKQRKSGKSTKEKKRRYEPLDNVA